MTRVRLIDFETNNVRVVYDHFFKPPSPTMDYLVSQLIVIRAPPFFLAITPHLRALITPTTILLGHSPEPDLCTLLPTVHRYRLDIPSPMWVPAQAGTGKAYAQVARSHHTGS